LTHKAQAVGYDSQVILSGRRINDNMGIFVANKVIKLMIAKGIRVKDSNVLVLGMTFKENCPDIRNSRVIDVIKELEEFGCNVEICDPMADNEEVQHEYGVSLLHGEKDLRKSGYDAVVLAVSHTHFLELDFKKLRAKKSIVYDVKSFLPRDSVDGRL
jgi:UDP-N-acetyl-D-galactosamine dehydrogenase